MHPLTQKITILQHRLILRRRLVAACWIVATVLAAALALGLIDYVIRYSDRGLRIIATTALAAAAAWAVYRWWYVPNRSRLIPLSVARRIEVQFPFLGDLLASAVEFLNQSEDDPAAGSAQLRRHVIAKAQTAVDHLPLDEVIDRRPLRRAAAWLAAAALALAVCLAIDARAVGTALVRMAAPFGATEWPRENHLAFRDPPTRLAAGQPFEAELIDEAGELPDEVRIEYRITRDGRPQQEIEKVTRVGDVMVARRENVGESFAFRASGGDDDTMPWHEVTVVEPPRLESMEITVHPPAYTGLPVESAERHLEVLAGTGIEVRGATSAPLRAARIVLDDEIISGSIGPDAAGQDGRAFHIASNQWLAKKSGTYQVNLADSDGLTSTVGQWSLRVQPDPPPTIAWQWPSDDLFVTPAAVVPIELATKDNLAIHTVELIVERPGQAEGGDIGKPEESRLELFRGPEKVVVEKDAASISHGDSRTIEHTLNLGAMNVPVGTQLTLTAEATDYRPGIGRTVAPRRITIITADELEARLADRQAQIVRQLERALATERTTREDARRLEIQQRDAGAFTVGDRNALQSVDLNQRRIGRMLIDPAEGVPALIDALLTELEVNRLPASDTRATMRELTAALDRLAAGPLPSAESELTSARKAADAPAEGDNAALLARSLATAGAAQDQVIAQLEQLLGELGGWADYRRFARQLAELRQDQIAHEKTSRAEIGLETLPLDVRELSRSQRANRNKATAGEDALARRYEKIEQGMDALARELAVKDAAAAGTLADAVALARELTIGAHMHETTRDLGENRVGVALERENKIASDLEQVLDVLRNRSEDRLDELVNKLRQAEEHLAQLRQQAAQLREQIQRAEQQGANADPRQMQQLQAHQEQLRREAKQLARQLDRLQADEAGRSAQSAAARLNNQQQPGGIQNAENQQQPSSSNDVKKAEEDLADAARQLAERRQQAELDLALEFVRRFQAELQELIARQQAVLRDTAALDKNRAASKPLSPDQSQKLKDLIDAERNLAGLAREHGEALLGLGAVRVSLEDAARRLDAAADLLVTANTGDRVQQAEARALQRLEGMLEAFAQTAAEAGGNQGGSGQGGQGGAERRPTFELLEVKMLRMLQVDLNERTRAYQERLAASAKPSGPQEQAALNREVQELAAEQRRLAGLVEEMLSRDNEKRQE